MNSNTVSPEIYAPGMWKCRTCGFVQIRSILAPQGMFANTEVLMDPCPNEGDVMHPVTWQELAKDNEAAGIKLLEERTSLEGKLKEAAGRIAALEKQVAESSEIEELHARTVGKSVLRAGEILAQGNWENIDHAATRVVAEREELRARASALVPVLVEV